MYTTGVITRHQYRVAVRHHNLDLKLGRLYKRIWQPDFFQYVRDELRRVYGEARVRTAACACTRRSIRSCSARARKAIGDTLNQPDDPGAAVVAIDPATGAIRAMTAVYPGRKHNQFNLISQARRQTGSTFKTFVLAAAVEAGMDPESTNYLSAPLHCDTGPCAVKPWDVKTYDSTYVGGTSVAKATLRSDNTVYARLTLDLGAEKVAKMARKLGVRTRLDVHGAYVPSIGLGSIAVSPLDMASAYATLAAGGIRSKPMAITKVILPNGKRDTQRRLGQAEARARHLAGRRVRGDADPPAERALRDGCRRELRQAGGRQDGDDRRHVDAWFCGYTPQLEATVWVGHPRAEIPMDNVHGIAVAGGTFPATIWNLFMSQAESKLPYRDFAVPDQQPTFTSWHGEWQWTGAYTPTDTTQSYTPTYTNP